jgi:hypothetical protein
MKGPVNPNPGITTAQELGITTPKLALSSIHALFPGKTGKLF